MGLDQYAYIAEHAENDASEDAAEREKTEIAYWRKHPHLQGWMAQLWRDRNPGISDEFNCVEVELGPDDLDDLEKAVSRKGLPPTVGFFFGTDGDDGYKEHDLKFIADARAALADGNRVFYNSWW